MEHIGTVGTTTLGNTLPKSRSTSKGRRWCLTLNNYTDEEFNNLVSCLEQRNSKYILGKEIGENGTPHIQGYFEVKNPISFNSIKKINERIHLEKAKGNQKQNIEYCSKEENFVTNFENEESEIQLILKKYYTNITWKPWQQQILNLLETEPDERSIYWVYDEKGNVGKSFLAKYIDIKYDAVIASGKKNDIFNQIAEYYEERKKYPQTVICDIPRCTEEKFISYAALEAIKNGHIYSGKYTGKKMIFLNPHVIVFSNSLPSRNKFSEDRVKLIEIR